MNYDGPVIEIVLLDTKQDTTQQIKDLVSKNIEGKNVGVFMKDKPDGALTKSVMDVLE